MLKVHALDGLTQIAEIVDWVEVEAAERDMAKGAWILKLPESDAATLLWQATWPGIAIYDTETNWWFGGYQTARDVEFDRGRYSYVFAGNDFQAELGNRLYYPSDLPNNELSETTWDPLFGGNILSLTTNATNMVSVSMGSVAENGEVDRRLSGLVVAADPDAGPVIDWTLSLGPVLDLLRDFFKGEDYTFRLRYDMDATGAVHTPRLLFETPPRQLSPLLLDSETGEITSAKTSERAALATVTIGAGEWVDDADHQLGRRYHREATAPTDWRTRYVEAYIDRGEVAATPLRVENQAYHRSQGQHRAASLADATVGGWGRDIDLGWKVRVKIGSGQLAEVVELPVEGQILRNTPAKGWTRHVAIGAKVPSSPAAAVMEAIGQLVDRVRRLER